MNIFGILKWIAITTASLLVVTVASFLFLAYPTIAEINRMSERGALQINARKEAMILETHPTRSLSITVFREAFMQLHDGAWYKSRKIPETLAIVYLRDFWFTEREWAAAYCDTNDCLDVWAQTAYQLDFDDLDEAKARCVLAFSIGRHRFDKCNAALGEMENNEHH